VSSSNVGLKDPNASAALPQPETGATLVIQTRMIRPLGEQIIIRTIPPLSVGSIIVPDSAKRITHQGTEEGPGTGSDELQYVNRWLFEDMTESMKRIAAGVPISEEDKELLKDLAMRANKSLLPKTETGIIPSNGQGLNFVEAEVIAVGPGKLGHDSTILEELALMLELGRSASVDLGNEPELSRVNELVMRARYPQRQPLSVKPGDRILYHPAVQRFDREIDPESVGLPAGERCFIISEMTSVLAVIERDE
jgi:co-chaperonin GroES (HSP10)